MTVMHDILISTNDAGAMSRLSGSHLREPEERSQRRIAVGLAVSLCVHVLLFVFVPRPKQEQDAPAAASQGPLVVRLNSLKASPPPAVAQTTPTPPAPRTPSRAPRPREMFTVPGTTPQAIAIAPEPPAPPVPAKPVDAAPTDFMSMVNANRERRAAAEAASGGRGREPSADDIASANLNRNLQTLTRGEGTSGVFQILSKGHRAAQFSFNGWTGDRRNSRRDIIDVDAGPNGNVEKAIIRRMIELIRTHYKGDFNWESHRLGRVVVLSARIEDTAGLEEFMMKEFF